MDGINKRIDEEKSEREKGLNSLSDKISTEIRDREEVNEAVTDALQVSFAHPIRDKIDRQVSDAKKIFQIMLLMLNFLGAVPTVRR